MHRIADSNSFFDKRCNSAISVNLSASRSRFETTGSVKEFTLMVSSRSILMNKLELLNRLNSGDSLELVFSSNVSPGYPFISFCFSSRIITSPFQIPIPFA